jgi:hypothetical protein
LILLVRRPWHLARELACHQLWFLRRSFSNLSYLGCYASYPRVLICLVCADRKWFVRCAGFYAALSHKVRFPQLTLHFARQARPESKSLLET